MTKNPLQSGMKEGLHPIERMHLKSLIIEKKPWRSPDMSAAKTLYLQWMQLLQNYTMKKRDAIVLKGKAKCAAHL